MFAARSGEVNRSNLPWFTIAETRGQIESGKVARWQVTLKVGFTLDE